MAYMIKDYRKAVGDAAEKVFKKVVELKCRHVSTASWDEMVSNRTINCNGSGAISLQLAGCLDKGVRMGHVPTKGISPSKITSIDKAMYNRDKIRHCRFVWVNCYYKDLPVWLKQRGIIYIQWSNCCTSAGRGSDGKFWVWSTNEEGGYHRQKDGSMRYDQYKETKDRSGVLSNGGHYPWGGKIYVCIVPEEKWLQHWAVEVMLEKHGQYGFMDYTGKWIADPVFTYAEPFNEGLAMVEKDGVAGMIDTDGRFVIPMVFDYVSSVSGGIIAAYDETCGWVLFNKMQR